MKIHWTKPKSGTAASIQKRSLIITATVSIIALVVSIIIDIYLSDWELWKNIFLGAFASGAISFVTIFVPYYSEKGQVINDYYQTTKNIFLHYRTVLYALKCSFDEFKSTELYKDKSDEEIQDLLQTTKEFQMTEAQSLKNEIGIFIEKNKSNQFSSNNMRIIYDVISQEIYETANMIMDYYERFNFQNDQLKEVFQEKYFELLCEFCELLYNDINKEYPYNNISTKFNLIFKLGKSTNINEQARIIANLGQNINKQLLELQNDVKHEKYKSNAGNFILEKGTQRFQELSQMSNTKKSIE